MCYECDDPISWRKWNPDAFEFVECDPDDPDAEPWEWDEGSCEWVYIGIED